MRFFQLCFIPLLRLSCRKMGARPGLDFIRLKWLHVIINDDFLEKGECYNRALLPSIICLGRLRIASKCIFNLWHLRQGVGSLAQWLEHWIFNQEDWVRIPGKTGYFFSYASFLCYGFHVVRHFIQIASLGDNLHESQILSFGKNKKNIMNLLSAEFAHSRLSVKWSSFPSSSF